MFGMIKKGLLVSTLCITMAIPRPAYAEDIAATPDPIPSAPQLNLQIPAFSYAILREGQKLTATRDTYLLSPDSFARITTEYEFMQRRYDLYLTERLQLASLENNLRVDLLTNQNSFLETELERTNRLLVEVQQSRRQDLTPLWVAVSFVAGCALTVGLVYALQPGMEQ